VDAAIGTLLWWWLGFGFAFGETKGRFIGTSLFAMNDSSFKSTNANAVYDLNFPFFFFQWAFAATAATIVSGSMAERCKLEAYFLYTMFISMFVYPVIVHWCWGEGWLSAFGTDPSQFIFRGSESNNFIDFAGSGVVHMVGGFSGLMGAAVLGPRLKRFQNGVAVPIHGHNMVYTVLGTILLWVGWYGFNCGSTLAIVGYSKLAGKIAVTTTIAAATAGCTSLLYCRAVLDHYDMSLICNAILAGLVGVTAGCAVVEPWGAFLIGVGACIVYVLASKFILEVLKIDDPVDASALHGCTGLWGVIAVGIFGTDENAQFAGYNGSANGHHPFRSGEQFGVQIVGGVCILVWTCLASGILFVLIDKVVGLRVDEEQEIQGLDCHHHGHRAYRAASTRNFAPGGRDSEGDGAVEMAPASHTEQTVAKGESNSAV
jgi:ammonium transporter, Amt family